MLPKGAPCRTSGSQPQTLTLSLPALCASRALTLPKGSLGSLLSAVPRETWLLALPALDLAPGLFFSCSPRRLVGSTKEDPALQPAWSCLPLASGCGQQEEYVSALGKQPAHPLHI